MSLRPDHGGAPDSTSGAPLPSAVVLVVVNLLPVWAVATGRMAVGEVFLVYWVENVVLWLVTIPKVATARGPGPRGPGSFALEGVDVGAWARPLLALFFAVHYGLFTLVHGGFAHGIAASTGDGASLDGGLLWLGLWVGLGHVVSLALNWFRAGERHGVGPTAAMLAPYPRMAVLHVAVVASGFLLVRGDHGTVLVVLLCVLKTALDLVLHLRERSRARNRSAAPSAAPSCPR